MLRTTLCLLLPLLGLAGGCGRDGGGGGDAADSAENTQQQQSYSVAKYTDLSPCSEEDGTAGHLVYIVEERLLRHCDPEEGKWLVAEMGVGITRVQTLPALPDTDFCTSDEGTCSWEGGVILTYADGSRVLTATWSYMEVVSPDTDLDTVTRVLTIPAAAKSGKILIHELLSTGSDGDYYDVYLRVTGKAADGSKYELVRDDSGNGLDSSDTVLRRLLPTQ
jgi:hypothetical protein